MTTKPRSKTDNIEGLTFSERDEYNREPIAENLIRLIQSDVDISPIVIDGQWGTGKTEFCHKLKNLLKATDRNTHTAYIDAFKADHADEPLVTLVAAIANLLEDEERANFIQKAIPAVRFGLKTLGKALVAWTLKQNADDIGDEFEGVIQEAANQGLSAAIEQTIEDHQEAEATLSSLREALQEIAETNRLVLFVDELDRCRPDFAIAMLESIKHVFDVPNVTFVLVSNLTQLRYSVNHCYGAGVDAQRYLDKFINFSFTLADSFTRDRVTYISASIEHARSLINSDPVLSQIGLTTERAATFKLIKILITTNTLSLREVETYIRHLQIFATIHGTENIISSIRQAAGHLLQYLLGVFIFCFDKSLADKITKNHIDGMRIANLLGVKEYIAPKTKDPNPPLETLLSVMAFYESDYEIPDFTPRGQKENADEYWVEKLMHFYGPMSDYSPGDKKTYAQRLSIPIRLLRME